MSTLNEAGKYSFMHSVPTLSMQASDALDFSVHSLTFTVLSQRKGGKTFVAYVTGGFA